jgi:uncharacterized protein YjbJ (UPF0337 family)
VTWDRIEGNWKQFKGKAKEQWAKLSDEALDATAGKREQLAGRIQEAYGTTRAEVEKQIAAWQARVK